jgi:hypothetical protein
LSHHLEELTDKEDTMMKWTQTKVLNRMRLTMPCILLTAAVALGGLGGCAPSDDPGDGGGAEGGNDAAAPKSSDSAAPPETALAGVTGKISFQGTPPERVELPMDEECEAHVKGEPTLSDDLVVGEQGGLRWSFVYISNPPEGDYAVPEEPVVLDQVGCRYTPHLIGLQAGQRLLAKNSDPFTHNVRTYARINRAVNMTTLQDAESRLSSVKSTAKVEKEVRIKCDIHPWMQSFMFILDHPFYAVTDEGGNFQIEGLPDGSYDLTVWHEMFDEQIVPITVENGSASVETSFKSQDL